MVTSFAVQQCRDRRQRVPAQITKERRQRPACPTRRAVVRRKTLGEFQSHGRLFDLGDNATSLRTPQPPTRNRSLRSRRNGCSAGVTVRFTYSEGDLDRGEHEERPETRERDDDRHGELHSQCNVVPRIRTSQAGLREDHGAHSGVTVRAWSRSATAAHEASQPDPRDSPEGAHERVASGDPGKGSPAAQDVSLFGTACRSSFGRAAGS